MGQHTYQRPTTGGGGRPTSSTGPLRPTSHSESFEEISRAVGPGDQVKIRLLQEAVKRIVPSYGYVAATTAGGKGTRFKVRGPLGDRAVRADQLLNEMENLAHYLKIDPQVLYGSPYGGKSVSRDPPEWLDEEGQGFWRSVVRRELRAGRPLASGTYCRRYGPKIRFLLSLKDPFKSTEGDIQLETKEHETQEDIVWAHVSSSRIRLEAFKYLPTDRKQYDNDLRHRAALDFNRAMYTDVELRKMAPSDAYDKWGADSKKYQQAVLLLIAASFVGP